MPTIIHEATTGISSPVLIQTESVEVEAGNIIHRISGSREPYISLREDSLRVGTHQAFYVEEDDALAALELLRLPGAFTLEYSDRPTFEMRFVTRNRIVLRLDQSTRDHWYLEFDFQEISP